MPIVYPTRALDHFLRDETDKPVYDVREGQPVLTLNTSGDIILVKSLGHFRVMLTRPRMFQHRAQEMLRRAAFLTTGVDMPPEARVVVDEAPEYVGRHVIGQGATKGLEGLLLYNLPLVRWETPGEHRASMLEAVRRLEDPPSA